MDEAIYEKEAKKQEPSSVMGTWQVTYRPGSGISLALFYLSFGPNTQRMAHKQASV